MHWRPRSLYFSIRYIRTQARYDYKPRYNIDSSPPKSSIPTPRRLVQFLDEFVVGQENAKKVLSVAVYNHYNRVNATMTAYPTDDDVQEWNIPSSVRDFRSSMQTATLHPHPHRTGATLPLQPPVVVEKSNILMIGPTGSGKTLLARTLAKVLDVPFSVSDATSFTQAGYVGEDVDMCIHRLLQAAHWDVHRASMGIVYIDEVDKLSRRSGNSGPDGTRDVGGEGVQQALLRMMEGATVTVQAKGSTAEGPGTTPNSTSVGSIAGIAPGSKSGNSGPSHELYQIDTSNVLFIFSGAFVGLDAVVRQRLAKGSIGFAANLSDMGPVSGGEGFLPFFTPNGDRAPSFLNLVEPPDIVKYGFIPEFISRLPTITTLSALSPYDLLRILTEVHGSLVSQYTAIFRYSGAEIRFTNAALQEICRRAAERGGGARGLRGIMETILLDAMYEVPGSSVRYVLIDKAVARGDKPALYWSRGQRDEFYAAFDKDPREDKNAS